MNSQIKNKEDYFDTTHLKAELKGRAMRGAGATISANIFSFVVHIFSTVILARLLTPNDFGLIAMVTTFSLLLQNFGVNGFTEAIIQKEDLNHEMTSTLFWTNAAISSGLTLIFILFAPVIAWFYHEPHLYKITVGIAFSIISAGMTVIHMGILRRNMQFYITSAISVTAMIISLLTAIVMAWMGMGYWALIANIILQPFITAICAWIFCGWRPGRPGKLQDITPILKFAMHTYGNFTLNYFSRNIDKLLIGWRYDAQSLGYYKKAYDLFALPVNQLIHPISNVALAALSRLTEDPIKYRHYYLSAVSIIAFIGMPLSAMLTLAGYDIILLVLGPQWTKAGEVFCYFGASIGILLIYGTQSWLHLSLGRPDRWLRWGLIECIPITCFFIAGLQFGIHGVAIAYSMTLYLLAGPCLWYAGIPINLTISSLLSAIWRYFLAALTAGGLSYVLFYHLPAVSVPFAALHVFFRIVLASLMCGILYLGFIIVLYQSLSPIKNFFYTARQMLPGRFQKT